MAFTNPTVQAALVAGAVSLLVMCIPRFLPSRVDRASANAQNITAMQAVIQTLRAELEELQQWQQERIQDDAKREEKHKADQALMRLMVRRWENVVRTVPSIGATVSNEGVVSTMPGPRTLVVDDDPGIRTFIGDVLLREGLVPVMAETAAEALALATGSGVALAIIDLYLTGEHTSDWLIHGLRALPGLPIPVIVMTAATDTEAGRRIRALDPFADFSKPFDIDTVLLPKVRAALGYRETEARAAAEAAAAAVAPPP